MKNYEYDLGMELLKKKIREHDNSWGIPHFHLNGRRYRGRISYTKKLRWPMHHYQDYGLGRIVWRFWVGRLMLKFLIDDGGTEDAVNG